ncbi:hypothetical protein A3I99_03500 [Candidatus Kaiserbacteria bacterium RIFCSPLOWO2_02_FULL_45_11b]|uniref:Endonuclease/exonuclease/phosphatase domain-containing protein n=1 Tax=Candidatus Kaiserbacteria bacterium RIFCSPLOWO2_12_FULL_45_26 TaxID=1798525 RepID=A0A1F6FH24_9BACT|nr:MAG: hypothetical protein A2Z56_03220 [Candidatus Kaiserbacteria bacterium RIFCSPHIGHO2_12_45_16]OGG69991.1 MAG: hypothetical protein A2929_02375 [Candidatus Kaiserbacteria bacterium RIFCSPLOWO2_01_FULL_45_25]OGG83660.1 MAG: hypothetical protein A3I99_03500 [Candidatus Kaiserbacteria bacterium RIFCSPLOWO2_02_FULL_45_11b]OGG85151.1 MAG: hypothetical protein A3G90_03785 [Candidatus Kaiserbacteria bacterium RIFCSPLOWO2_12_FULL_45_26]
MKLKVLSWNIWQGVFLTEVINFLKEADADIIALQEVSNDEREITQRIAESLGYTYVTAFDMNLPMKYVPAAIRSEAEALSYGSVILTKHKILEGGSVLLTEEDKRTIATAKVKIGDTVLSVFGLHLKHTHQEPSDLQNQQADNLLKLLPHNKTIVLGDFNALPNSYPIEKVSAVLQNTEVDSAEPTWSMYKDGCSVCQEDQLKHKLDYIFVSKDINVTSYEVGKSNGADHLPVMATIEL